MRTPAPRLLAAVSALVLASAPAAEASPRRVADRGRLPARSDLAVPVSADMAEVVRRHEEIRVRTLFGESWDEVLIETSTEDLEPVLSRHGGAWRGRGLGRDAIRKPNARRAMEWYLDLWADPAVRRVEPNPKAVHPGCRQMSIDILESGSGLSPDLATQPALEPTAAESLDATGVTVGIVDSGVAALPSLAETLLPAINVLHPQGPVVVRDDADLAEHADDANGHGTAMASLVASVARGALIQPVRVVGEDCEGTAFDLATGMTAAADAGATILLVSLSTPHDSPVLRRSVEALVARGVLIVAAAGNASVVEYPAAYPGVLSVTAVDRDGLPPAFAPQGDAVSLAAPGVAIQALGPSSALEMTGTSPAAALVAAAAARSAWLQPAGSASDWASWLLLTARPSDEPGQERRVGAGVLDFTSLK